MFQIRTSAGRRGSQPRLPGKSSATAVGAGDCSAPPSSGGPPAQSRPLAAPLAIPSPAGAVLTESRAATSTTAVVAKRQLNRTKTCRKTSGWAGRRRELKSGVGERLLPHPTLPAVVDRKRAWDVSIRMKEGGLYLRRWRGRCARPTRTKASVLIVR